MINQIILLFSATERKFSYRTTFRDDGIDRDDAPETAGDISSVVTRRAVNTSQGP